MVVSNPPPPPLKVGPVALISSWSSSRVILVSSTIKHVLLLPSCGYPPAPAPLPTVHVQHSAHSAYGVRGVRQAALSQHERRCVVLSPASGQLSPQRPPARLSPLRPGTPARAQDRPTRRERQRAAVVNYCLTDNILIVNTGISRYLGAKRTYFVWACSNSSSFDRYISKHKKLAAQGKTLGYDRGCKTTWVFH